MNSRTAEQQNSRTAKQQNSLPLGSGRSFWSDSNTCCHRHLTPGHTQWHRQQLPRNRVRARNRQRELWLLERDKHNLQSLKSCQYCMWPSKLSWTCCNLRKTSLSRVFSSKGLDHWFYGPKHEPLLMCYWWEVQSSAMKWTAPTGLPLCPLLAPSYQYWSARLEYKLIQKLLTKSYVRGHNIHDKKTTNAYSIVCEWEAEDDCTTMSPPKKCP